MQQTRRHILEVLHQRGEATVDDLVKALTERINHDLTAVTVRHHLDILRTEELVTAPIIRRRNTPGRPQHVYALTDKALDQFPNNYQNLAVNLLSQIKATLPPTQVNVILDNIADEMIANAGTLSLPLEARLDQVAQYLNRLGYDAQWETRPEGSVLMVRNCPYRQIAGEHPELCALDSRVITGLVGIVPRRLSRMAESNEMCAFLFPVPQGERAR